MQFKQILVLQHVNKSGSWRSFSTITSSGAHTESVSTVRFRLYCAGCCLKTTGRGRRASHWSDCWVLGAQRRACDLRASWDWSGYSWTPFHWTSLHGTGPWRNRIWERKTEREKFNSQRHFKECNQYDSTALQTTPCTIGGGRTSCRTVVLNFTCLS